MLGEGFTTPDNVQKEKSYFHSILRGLNSGPRSAILLFKNEVRKGSGRSEIERRHLMGQILVIDDDNAVLTSICKVLKYLGYEVKCARDGKEGIAALENHRNVALVITDIRMPGMDGNAVARYIRNSKSKGVSIVALTGSDDEIDRGLFDTVLIKPFNIKELMDITKVVP